MHLCDSVWLESPLLECLETGSIKDPPTGALLDLDGCDRAAFCINVQSKNSATGHVPHLEPLPGNQAVGRRP